MKKDVLYVLIFLGVCVWIVKIAIIDILRQATITMFVAGFILSGLLSAFVIIKGESKLPPIDTPFKKKIINGILISIAIILFTFILGIIVTWAISFLADMFSGISPTSHCASNGDCFPEDAIP